MHGDLKGQFFHEEVYIMINFEAMQIICVSLKPH